MSVQKKMAIHNFMKSSNAKSNYVFKTYLLRLPIFYDLSLGPSTKLKRVMCKTNTLVIFLEELKVHTIMNIGN